MGGAEMGWRGAGYQCARGAQGFTLYELMITVAVAAVLLAVAVPGYQAMALNSARAAAVNDMVAAMTLARTEAQKQRRQVVVCPMVAGACAPGTGNWNNGWLVYVNMDTTDPAVFDSDDTVLTAFERRNTTITVAGNTTRFIFRPSPHPNLNGTVRFCDRRGSPQARSVVVAVSGRVQTAESTPAVPIPCP